MIVTFLFLFCIQPPDIDGARLKDKPPDARSETASQNSSDWQTLFSSPSERQLKQNQMMTKIPRLGKEWLVSFEVKPTLYRSFGLVLQMTTGGKVGQYGDRTPAIWLHKTKGVFVSSAVNGDGNFGRYFLPPIGEGNWTRIDVGQRLLENSSYIYSISIDGVKRFSVENKQPGAFENVRVWAGDPWVNTQKGAIRNITVKGKVDEATGSWDTVFKSSAEQDLVRNKLLATIPELAKEWRVSFEVKPRSFHNTSSASVLHMTIGGKGADLSDNYGDRTPALWLHGTKGVLVSSAVNRRNRFMKWISKIPPIGNWTNIEVHQVLEGLKLMFEILIDEEKVFSVENEKPENFHDVKIFASSRWGATQNGTIRQLLVESRMSGKLGKC